MNLDKLHNEPFFKDLSHEDAIAGGYFTPTHEKINWNQHINIPCTPINFLAEASNEDKPVVLISTGAHCPLHNGHISIMESARDAVEEKGYKVIGGYLSSGHDQYIKEKTGSDWMPIHDRLKWANELLTQDWLAMDPWEGVFAPGAVNFTSVVYRLQEYIKRFYIYASNVKIFFVCGDDNARFLIPFENTEIGIVIAQRPGYNEIRSIFEERASDEKDIIFCYSDINTSSTEIRKQSKYRKYKNRKEIQAYARLYDSKIEEEVLNILRNYYSQVWPKFVEDQTEDIQEYTKFKHPVINMDVETNFGNKLDISRLYDNFGQKQLGYTHRPGSKILPEQFLKFFREGIRKCYLFDDDIYTGNTMRYVEKQLKMYFIDVVGKISFAAGNTPDHDIVDIKDFLLMYNDGGLVTKIKGDLVRVPYIYPFVDPCARASIQDPLQFSIDMWKKSMRLYYRLNPIYLRDNLQYNFLTKLGFKSDNTLYDVCEYYYKLLTNIKDENYR